MCFLRNRLIIILSCLSILTAYSQNNDGHNSIFISGVVKDMELLENLPFVNISIDKKHNLLSDINGHFNVLIDNSDTLTFSQSGYENAVMSLSNTSLTGDTVHLVILMKLNPLEIPEATIVPYANYSQFKAAFLNLKTDNNQMLHSNRNAEIIKSQINSKYMPDIDGYSVYKNMMIMKDQNNNAFIILSTDFNKGLFGGLRAILKHD
jgi:hypothetical protein